MAAASKVANLEYNIMVLCFCRVCEGLIILLLELRPLLYASPRAEATPRHVLGFEVDHVERSGAFLHGGRQRDSARHLPLDVNNVSAAVVYSLSGKECSMSPSHGVCIESFISMS